MAPTNSGSQMLLVISNMNAPEVTIQNMTGNDLLVRLEDGEWGDLPHFFSRQEMGASWGSPLCINAEGSKRGLVVFNMQGILVPEHKITGVEWSLD